MALLVRLRRPSTITFNWSHFFGVISAVDFRLSAVITPTILITNYHGVEETFRTRIPT